MSTLSKPRVFLVDDHALIRAGIRAELSHDVEIVGEADEVTAAIEMIIERTPDVVLLDVHMPDGGGARSDPGSRCA
jgi:DNA-binding NarL/FixJ family response regulator